MLFILLKELFIHRYRYDTFFNWDIQMFFLFLHKNIFLEEIIKILSEYSLLSGSMILNSDCSQFEICTSNHHDKSPRAHDMKILVLFLFLHFDIISACTHMWNGVTWYEQLTNILYNVYILDLSRSKCFYKISTRYVEHYVSSKDLDQTAQMSHHLTKINLYLSAFCPQYSLYLTHDKQGSPWKHVVGTHEYPCGYSWIPTTYVFMEK